MKIKPHSLNQDLDSINQDALKVTRHKAPQSEELDQIFGGQADDISVELGLARTISSELDPERMLAERREKVEKLKAQVRAGKYVIPDSDQLARKVGEDIVYEIFSQSSEKGV